MSSDHGWSKEQIIAMLDENSFSYQNVPLPHGLETGGHDRSDTARAIFGEDVAGKSVFDLGCKYGYFCFAAEESGAVKIRGVDIEPENIRKSRLLAQSRGSIAQFERLDIEKQEIQDRYDYVLCLNVLHHLRNPLAVLEKLIAATRQKLVLEVAGFRIAGPAAKRCIAFVGRLAVPHPGILPSEKFVPDILHNNSCNSCVTA